MINFFIKHKKARGVITVFLTLIYLSMYLMIGVFVDGGRIKMAQTAIEDAQQIATENVMSQYNRGLYEYYGLFGVSDKSTDDISKEVQDEIEKMIGLKIPQDEVRTFMEDVWVGGTSLVDDPSVQKAIDNINDSHRRFNPYGVEVVSASTSYIDLTNTDAMRSQMRDDMRYSAPFVLGANFFDAVNKFMSLGDAASTVASVSEILSDERNGIDVKQDTYNASIATFSNTFHKYVEKTYHPTMAQVFWGYIEKNDAVVKAAKKVIDVVKNLYNSVKESGLSGLWAVITGNGNKDTTVEVSDDIDNENTKYTIAEDMHLDEAGGFTDIVNNYANNLYNLCDDFDNENGWPKGRKLDEERWTDSLGNEHIRYYYGSISREDHRDRAITAAENKKQAYLAGIDGLINYSNLTTGSLEKSIQYAEECLDAIDKIEGHFLSKSEELPDDSQSKEIYEQYMVTYLRQWNNLTNQKERLLVIKDKLDDLKSILDTAKDDVEYACNSIPSESFDENWAKPEKPSSSLRYYRTDDIENFKMKMAELVVADAKFEGLRELQNKANGKKISQDIFSLLSTLAGNKESEKENIIDKNAKSKSLFGEIVKHKESDNETDEVKLDDLDDSNIDGRILEIMNTAKKLIEDLPKSLVDNIYDEAYIMSHCRDYVHTYRYNHISSEQKNSGDIDTILNPKFITNQSNTKYLSNTQFRNIQVTPAEIEYIIWGDSDEINGTRMNVTKMYASIFTLRLALNYLAVILSERSRLEVDALAAASFVAAPAVRAAAPLIYAIPQSITETKSIMYDCQKVNIWNGGPNLDLWDAIKSLADEVKEEVNKAAEGIKETAKKELESIKNNAGELTLVAAVRAQNHIPENINAVTSHISGEILLDPLSPDAVENPVLQDHSHTMPTKVSDIKAGYSDYLLVFLFIRGFGKDSQISNLQDVIETNMKKAGQEDFSLANTYSKIAVDTKSTVKYIFMTQSFMRKTFTYVKEEDYSKYPVRTKTAFSY